MLRFSRSALAALLLLAVLACDDYYDEMGEMVGEACGNEQRIKQLRPRNESDQAFVDGFVVASLECGVGDADLTVRTLQNSPVTGLLTLHHSGRQVRFKLSMLSPETTYEAHLETPGGFRDWRFRTSVLGSSAGPDLAGDALALLVDQGLLLDPPGMDDLLLPALADMDPVLQFMADASGSTVQTRLGGYLPAEEGDPQDPAQPVIDLSANWDDPLLRFGPEDVTWRMPGWDFFLEDAIWTAAVAPDQVGGGGGSIEALWDTRSAEDVLGTGPGSLCMAAQFGGSAGCVFCSDGALACLPLLIVHVPANPWFGMLEAPSAG